jgi:cell division protein FtsQ
MPSFARRRTRVVLAVLALLVALGCFGMWLRTSSLVGVDSVTITGAEGRQAGEIRDVLTAASLDMTTLAVDEGALRRAVSGYPVVRSLRTSTDFPHRLRSTVQTYRPVAALQAGGALTAVAADGTLLRGSAAKNLPLVGTRRAPTGDRVGDAATRRAIAVVGAAPAALRHRVERVFRGSRGLAATVSGGPKLYFGGGRRLRAKWSAAAQVLARSDARGASYIDVRIPERPVAGGFLPAPAIVSPSTQG